MINHLDDTTRSLALIFVSLHFCLPTSLPGGRGPSALPQPPSLLAGGSKASPLRLPARPCYTWVLPLLSVHVRNIDKQKSGPHAHFRSCLCISDRPKVEQLIISLYYTRSVTNHSLRNPTTSESITNTKNA